MRILFLDDDQRRWEIFSYLVSKRHYDTDPEIVWVKNVEEAIKALETVKWDQIYLDHDLADFHYASQEQSEGTGEDVAKHLALMLRGTPLEKLPSVVVHSYNFSGSQRMLSILEEVMPAWAEKRPFGPHMLI